MDEFLFVTVKWLSVFFLGIVKFFSAAFLAIAYDMDFIPSVLITVAGGMAGYFIFTYAAKTVGRWMKKKKSIDEIHQIKMNRFSRFIIFIKRKFGVLGIAFLTPILLQIPIGVILANRIEKNKSKVMLSMLASLFFWAFLTFGIYQLTGFKVGDLFH
jgi:membrane protein YqaA with SNARE-associated domain